MKNTARKAVWQIGLPQRQLELFLADVRRSLNLVYWETFEVPTTLTAAVTDLWADTMPSASTWNIEFDVIAYATDGSAAAYRRLSRFKRAAAAAATLLGTDTIGTDREDVAGWDVTISASGNGPLLQVTGDVTRTVSWKASVRVLEVR